MTGPQRRSVGVLGSCGLASFAVPAEPKVSWGYLAAILIVVPLVAAAIVVVGTRARLPVRGSRD